MASTLTPGYTLAGYRIEAVAGRGGMGIVYRATQVALARTVALKLIAADLARDESFRERFKRESRLAAMIDHPHVLGVYAAGEADGHLFISMRWVEGSDLRALIVEQGGLAAPRAARVVSQVAAGLDAAHARGLVHRDVKPPNVLIELRGNAEHAYLSDFGLTKRVGSGNSLTAAGQWVGTPDYVAPEQVEGRAVDARTDVYALGCVLFQTLTGSAPYPRDSDVAVLYAHMQDPPPSVQALRPELPAEFDTVISRALAKDPNDRYPSAGDLGRAAVAAAAGQVPTYVEHSVATGEAAGGRTATPAPPPQPWAPSPPTPPEAAPAPSPPPPSAAPGRRFPRAAVAAVAAVVVAAGAAGVLLLGGGDEEEPAAKRTAATGPLPEPPKPGIDRVALGANAEPTAIAGGSSDLYVVDKRAGQLAIVDAASQRVAGRVDVGRDPLDVAVDAEAGRAWVTSPADGTIAEVDTRDRRLVGRPFEAPRRPHQIAAADGVLAVGADDRVMGIDAKTRQHGTSDDLNAGVADVAVQEGFVQVATAYPQATLRTFTLSGHKPEIDDTEGLDTDDIPTGIAIADNVAWVPVSARGYVADGEIGSGSEPHGAVVRVDLAAPREQQDKLIGRPITVGREPRGIAFDRGVFWVPSPEDDTVTRIDQRTGRVIGKPLKVDGIGTGGVAAADGSVWVAGESDLIRISPK